MLSEYSVYTKVTLEEDVKALAKHSLNNLTINLTPRGILPYHPLYNLSRT
jgi:hypothetical protein